jgi:hypothetical protein
MLPRTLPPPPEVQRARIYRAAFIVALVAAVLVGGVAVELYSDLVGISPCDGGLAPGGPSCASPPLVLTQLGFAQHVGGGYTASIVVTSASESLVTTAQIGVSVANVTTEAPVVLTSLVVESLQGGRLANYTASGYNWTTSQSAVLVYAVVFQLTSQTQLNGTYALFACERFTQPVPLV